MGHKRLFLSRTTTAILIRRGLSTFAMSRGGIARRDEALERLKTVSGGNILPVDSRASWPSLHKISEAFLPAGSAGSSLGCGSGSGGFSGFGSGFGSNLDSASGLGADCHDTTSLDRSRKPERCATGCRSGLRTT